MLADSHCHLDRLSLADRPGGLEAVIDAAQRAGVSRLLTVATDLAGVAPLRDLSHRYPQVRFSAGVHPLSDEIERVDRYALVQAAEDPHCVAIGETGLDYHYQSDTREAQQRAFALHLEVAATLHQPVIVHTREARDDTLRLIRAHADPACGGVLHCFTESWEMAKAALDLNFHISFSGILTFRNAGDLREVARRVPLDRLLVETDSPYLAPVPHRGRQNEPRFVREVAQCVADLKGLDLETLARETTRNYLRLFGADR